MYRCLQCKAMIEVKPGHRPRQYCSDECKQTAYRRRHGAKPRPTPEETETQRAVKRMAEIKVQWPGFDFGTYYLLQNIQKRYGRQLTDEIARAITREIKSAKQQP
jgi:hypothetical protein